MPVSEIYKNNEVVYLSNRIMDLVETSYRGFRHPYDYFAALRLLDFSHMDILIIDSAFKKMPLSRLDKTLMLKKDDYLNVLYLLADHLEEVLHNKSLRSPERPTLVNFTKKIEKLNLAQRLLIWLGIKGKTQT
jgi:hypothetical protein